MKRRELLRHLQQHGCSLLREGGRHSWWINPVKKRRSAIPRHTEIDEYLDEKSPKTCDVRIRDSDYSQIPAGRARFYPPWRALAE